jgi:hypothetical protein
LSYLLLRSSTMYRKAHYLGHVTLLISGLLLTSEIAFARGGGGHSGGGRSSSGHSGGSVHVKSYTKKDGTHVSEHTRGAPHAGFGSASHSSGVGSSSYSPPEPETASPNNSEAMIPESESTSLRAESSDRSGPDDSTSRKALTPETDQPTSPDKLLESPPVNVVPPSNNNFHFPLSSCGDGSSPQNIWYPVFINDGNLERVQAKFCHDAVSTIRQDSKVQAVQLASFSDRDRAAQFAQQVGGEVGKPTTPEDQQEKKQVSRDSIPTKDNARIRQEIVKADNSSTQTSSMPQAEEKGSNVMGIVTIGLALIGAGYWRGKKKAQSK